MPRRNAQRQILPAPRDDGASTASPELAEATCPLYALPNSAFAHVPPQDVKYLDYFIRQFRERLSLSRLGDSALSNFCKYFEFKSTCCEVELAPKALYLPVRVSQGL